MIVPDINLLLYAYDSDSPFHDRAREWWEDLLSSPTPVGLPWLVLLAFIRIRSNRRFLAPPMAPAAALAHSTVGAGSSSRTRGSWRRDRVTLTSSSLSWKDRRSARASRRMRTSRRSPSRTRRSSTPTTPVSSASPVFLGATRSRDSKSPQVGSRIEFDSVSCRAGRAGTDPAT